MSEIIFKADIRDWRMDAGEAESVPLDQRKEYTLTLTRGNDSQFCVEIKPKNEEAGAPAMEAFIEINNGLPCIHLSHELFGDNCLHAFGVEEGIAVVPENEEDRFSIDSQRLYPDSPSVPVTLYR